jgi:hypothetical protein
VNYKVLLKLQDENILDFIYSGRKVVTFDNCEDLLRAAAIFQMRQLHEKCEQFLLSNLTSENCLGAWKLAKSYDCPSLCKKSWSLILMNFTDICRFDKCHYFPSGINKV